jgi:glycosyltransferase involved in cell wall biosynthesis
LGQSTSVYHAAQAAQGQWLATLDGDGQNDPADIPGMLVLVRARQAGSNAIQLVAGHRVNRRDTASKRWASRFANGLRSPLLKDSTPDTGCGLTDRTGCIFYASPSPKSHNYHDTLTNSSALSIAVRSSLTLG